MRRIMVKWASSAKRHDTISNVLRYNPIYYRKANKIGSFQVMKFVISTHLANI